MRMVAVIKNKEHPEYGEISIPLPIKNSEYSRTIEMLSSLGFGDVLKKDCQIVELMRTFSIMTQLEGTQVNIDELDYLAKRLDGFEVGQEIQFEAVAAAKGLTSIDEFIDLTFSCDQVTVIHDFSNLAAVGRQHYLNLHGGCACAEDMENLDGYETALLLIDGGGGIVTPYGVLYDNGMQIQQLYKGGPFPAYLYDACELVVSIAPVQGQENTTYLYLPSATAQLERALQRGGIMDWQIESAQFTPVCLSNKLAEKLDLQRDSLWELNDMCKAIHHLSTINRKKIDAVIEYTHADTARQIRQIAENLDEFDFVPNVHTPEEYGRYLIQESGKFNYDVELEDAYNYAQFGQHRIAMEGGQFIDGGYIVYHGDLHLDDLLRDDSIQEGPQIGGL